MPMIYKYLPPERVTFFDDGLLRMTQPGDLNDPFECLAFHVDVAPGACVELDLERRRQAHEAAGHHVNPVLFNIMRAMMGAVARNEQTRTDWATDCYKSFVDFVNSRWGILSFSRTWASSTMWAHYTESHQGFCIGFDQAYTAVPMDTPTITCGNYHEVRYDERRSRKEVTTTVTVEPHTLFIKSKDWEYEKEVRVILELANADRQLRERSQRDFPIHLKHYPFDSVREIHVGYYSKGPLITRILEFAHAHTGITVYQMKPSLSDSFLMERQILARADAR